ncbi:magnesium protoporphyrin IX methyltransferase [Acuticoccus kandeliae]|uniref:magnesium protoporphyrin IX methyltransferase n=1 Tax=Acuticoccus kandeliae TaxID=2073160 RepID=UPI000D3E18BF|nr:magnesium protoporphyrin IX methyltransferase [Acuticoccus kandeliae]
MTDSSYLGRRAELETYFDRTAVDGWEKLTSNAKLSRIRETVRAGRDEMRAALLDWLPADLSGARVLDAGCGTGMLSFEMARRGADVVASDISHALIKLAKQRKPRDLGRGKGRIIFYVGDMLDRGLGRFHYVVAMDSLIHYQTDDMAGAIERIAERTDKAILFTFAPRTPALAAMHAVGRLFPRSDRAPAIEPVSVRKLAETLGETPGLADWRLTRTQRISRGFYTSHAQELQPK